MDLLIDDLLALEPAIRYVAIVRGSELVATRERSALADASSTESDRYEELLVNPTLIEMVRRRGEIRCGGRPIRGHPVRQLLPAHHPGRRGARIDRVRARGGPHPARRGRREVLTRHGLRV